MYFANIQEYNSKLLYNITSHHISNHIVCDDTCSCRNLGLTGGRRGHCICIEIHIAKNCLEWGNNPHPLSLTEAQKEISPTSGMLYLATIFQFHLFFRNACSSHNQSQQVFLNCERSQLEFLTNCSCHLPSSFPLSLTAGTTHGQYPFSLPAERESSLEKLHFI